MSKIEKKIEKLERQVEAQAARIDRLEALVATLVHKDDPAWKPAVVKPTVAPAGWIPADGWERGPEMTAGQRRMLYALVRKAKMSDPERRAWATSVLGREIDSFTKLTRAEAGTLIDRLEASAA